VGSLPALLYILDFQEAEADTRVIVMGVLDNNRHLEDTDKKYIWHPFTQMQEWQQETR